jgi:hypothetical protein
MKATVAADTARTQTHDRPTLPPLLSPAIIASGAGAPFSHSAAGGSLCAGLIVSVVDLAIWTAVGLGW